ncbi:MAG: hypothetical protein R6V47_04745, partial [Candidatus Delongbacteria bacterium]
MRIFRNILLISIPTVLILIIILELFFRFVITASNPPQSYFDDKDNILRFDTEQKTGYTTIGRFAEIKTAWRINNAGWNFANDYQNHGEEKLVAVIGDSYIEAFQVDVNKNYPHIMDQESGDKYRVYAFGKSGAPLSQDLHISRYVKKYYNPDVFIINLVHNDFDESVRDIKAKSSYFMQLSIDMDDLVSEIEPRTDKSLAQYSPIKRYMFKSAIFRYLYINLEVSSIMKNLTSRGNKNIDANIDVEQVEDNRDKIYTAVDYIISTLRKENPDKRIIYVLDG